MRRREPASGAGDASRRAGTAALLCAAPGHLPSSCLPPTVRACTMRRSTRFCRKGATLAWASCSASSTWRWGGGAGLGGCGCGCGWMGVHGSWIGGAGQASPARLAPTHRAPRSTPTPAHLLPELQRPHLLLQLHRLLGLAPLLALHQLLVLGPRQELAEGGLLRRTVGRARRCRRCGQRSRERGQAGSRQAGGGDGDGGRGRGTAAPARPAHAPAPCPGRPRTCLRLQTWPSGETGSSWSGAASERLRRGNQTALRAFCCSESADRSRESPQAAAAVHVVPAGIRAAAKPPHQSTPLLDALASIPLHLPPLEVPPAHTAAQTAPLPRAVNPSEASPRLQVPHQR